jgi:hypothetical protein
MKFAVYIYTHPFFHIITTTIAKRAYIKCSWVSLKSYAKNSTPLMCHLGNQNEFPSKAGNKRPRYITFEFSIIGALLASFVGEVTLV